MPRESLVAYTEQKNPKEEIRHYLRFTAIKQTMYCFEKLMCLHVFYTPPNGIRKPFVTGFLSSYWSTVTSQVKETPPRHFKGYQYTTAYSLSAGRVPKSLDLMHNSSVIGSDFAPFIHQ